MASGRLVLGAADPALNADGTPAVGATLTVYETGTTDLASIYSSSQLTTEIQNPQTANAAGRFYEDSTTIWADVSQGYDVVLGYPDGSDTTYTDVFLLGSTGGGGAFMPITGGTFTGPVYGLTPAANDDSTQFPTTAWLLSQLETYALLASPPLSGSPTTPDPTSPMGIANKEYVDSAVAGGATDIYVTLSVAGGVVTINDNVGFASVARSAVGVFAFVFTTPKPDTKYAVFFGLGNPTNLTIPYTTKTVNGFTVNCFTDNNNHADPIELNFLIKGA